MMIEKKNSQWARFTFAMAGLGAAWRMERSFRTEVIGAMIVFVALAAKRVEALWWLLAILSTAAILSAELVNTAVEAVCDALHPERHPLIKVAKDCASAAVLIANFTAVVFLGFLVHHLSAK